MKEYTYPIEIDSLQLTPEVILKEIGYEKVSPMTQVSEVVAVMLDEAKRLTLPSCTFRLFCGTIVGEAVQLKEGGVFCVGKILAPLLVGSERFVLFTATAGEGFHRWQRSLADEGDILRCFIADVIGTCLVEAVGDMMERLVEQQIYPLRHTNRFSPGYCGWKLTEQRQLFALLGGNPCAIHLSENCLMIPEKSISGIMGVGHDVNEKAYGCRYCSLETCYKRKKKKHE